ncbi:MULTISPECIES: winged helix-turn-helix domain-containing protein [unclassified Pseudoxanthomonas]|uniref:winged helix-turn-helix domain-containing protein n=1 Tax=unclassified Pseudoxanthomonas TaxID=2645906 RepID=UPI0008DEADAA|nr:MULTISPECIES: winged helix-turn-helix domain-containing protein [unclassified Pseudoxanthomonas]SFV33632.1 TolB amino-terminal domain-containing protein [Pseudoxanthomonas sp. YR558]
MPQTDSSRLAFDDVVIDFVGRRLLRAGREQTLEPKAFAVLALLAGSPGRVFTRDEILDEVWGHRHVTQSVINRVMSLLRQAVGEDAQRPRLLHTVYGIGYRFDLPAAGHIAASPGKPEGAPRWRQPWVIGSACALLLGLSAVVWTQRDVAHDVPSDGIATQARPSLAVLPFADLSQAGDQAHLADGLAEEIRNQLAQSPALRVVGRTSSDAFKDTDDLRGIGRALDVAYLLEGSVRRQGAHLRITARLVHAEDGSQLWSKTYARELRDVFAVQDALSRDVAHALSVRLDVARFNREQGGTTQVDAYERFLRWRSIVMREQFDVEHDRLRLQLAREMIVLDPQCVLCRDALASSLIAMAQELDGPQADGLRAEAAQVRDDIARLAPDSWVARRDRANAWWREGRRAEAIALARQVAEAGPPTKERAWDYAYMLYAMGHLEDTIALVEQVRAVEPRALFLSRDLQYDYTAARRYADAEAEYRRGLEMEGSQRETDSVAFFRQLAGKRSGGLPELRDLHQRLQRQEGFDTPFFRDLGTVLDDRGAMLALVRKALADGAYAGGQDAAYVQTSVADALGDPGLAVRALRNELALQPGFDEGRMPQYPYVSFWNAPYSGMRAHPDFKALLVQAGVADYWRQTGRWGDGCEPVGPDDFHCR